jgi:hypothetical protein
VLILSTPAQDAQPSASEVKVRLGFSVGFGESEVSGGADGEDGQKEREKCKGWLKRVGGDRRNFV